MLVGSLQNGYGLRAVSSYGTCEESAAGTETQLGRTEGVLYGAVWAGLRYKTSWRRWTVLSLGESVYAVVEQNHVEVDVAPHGMDEVVATNGKAVTIAANLPDGEVGVHDLCSCGNRCRASVYGLHGIGVDIVWQTA